MKVLSTHRDLMHAKTFVLLLGGRYMDMDPIPEVPSLIFQAFGEGNLRCRYSVPDEMLVVDVEFLHPPPVMSIPALDLYVIQDLYGTEIRIDLQSNLIRFRIGGRLVTLARIHPLILESGLKNHLNQWYHGNELIRPHIEFGGR